MVNCLQSKTQVNGQEVEEMVPCSEISHSSQIVLDAASICFEVFHSAKRDYSVKEHRCGR